MKIFPNMSLSFRHLCLAFASILIVAISSSGHVNGFSAHKVIDSPLLTEKIGSNRTIKVDINGNGDFKSVQEAINSVPVNNSQWVIIHIRKGVYREKIHIPKTKPYIFMRGNGRGKTAIVWSKSSENNKASATFTMEARNFIAFGISFKNEAPTGVAFTSQNQSVAAFVGGDAAAFYHCGFYSTHNTLFDYRGRHYYDNCYIQGSIDFIFGRGRSIFHNCDIFVLEDLRVSIHGSITAHNRENDDDSGFVFVKGQVYGIGDVYLGRAKGPYSRVIFAKTYLSKTIVPQGWTNWSYSGSTENLYEAEYGCYGPGAADAGQRAPWSKQITAEEAERFTSVDFIDGKEWLPAWI